MNHLVSGIALIAAASHDKHALVALHTQFLRVHEKAHELGLGKAAKEDFKRLACLALAESRARRVF
jgi:hypothetical protein